MPDFFDDLPPHAAAFLVDSVFEAQGVDFALVDADLRYLHVSPTLARINSRPASLHMGVPVFEGMEAEKWQQSRPHLEAALGGQTIRHQPHTGRKPSPTPHALASFIPVNLPQRAPLVALLIERQSDLARAQEDLQKAREKEAASAHAFLEQDALSRYEFMRDVLLSVTEGRFHLCREASDLPPRREAFGDPTPLALTVHGGIRELRQRAAQAAQAVGIVQMDWFDMETAIGEAAMNTVVHAGGGVGSVNTSTDNATLQVWVSDDGNGIATHHLPRAVLQKGFTTAGTMGYGFKMMVQTCDRMWLLTGGQGTTIVLEKDKIPPVPDVLAGNPTA